MKLPLWLSLALLDRDGDPPGEWWCGCLYSPKDSVVKRERELQVQPESGVVG